MRREGGGKFQLTYPWRRKKKGKRRKSQTLHYLLEEGRGSKGDSRGGITVRYGKIRGGSWHLPFWEKREKEGE